MFEIEKERLENKINEKNNRLQEIGNKQVEIEKREEIISKYENALLHIKYWKKSLIFILFCIIIMGILIVAFSGFSFLYSFLLISILGTLAVISFLGEDTLRTIKAKRITKEIQKEYESAKKIEEKDKELKLALTEEYNKIIMELESLKEMLSWFNKTEEMEKLGYVVKQIINNNQSQVEEQQELERPGIDTTSSLRVAFPPLN